MPTPRPLCIFVILGLLAACADDPSIPDPPHPTVLRVAPESVTLTSIGATSPVAVIVLDQDGNVMDAPVSWSSSEPTVASVESSGRITAVSNGSAVIQASIDSLMAEVTVTVDAPVAVSWEDLPPLPFPVAALAATSDGEQIYVFGGEDRSGKETHTQIYNISSGTWTQGTPVPEAVSWAVAMALPDGIHLVGGVTNSAAASTAHRIYDPQTNEWSIGTALPVAMAGGTGQYVDGKLVVMGGIDGPAHHSDNVHVYDPNTTQWSSGTAVPGARINWTSEILNGLIFGAGGGTPGIATSAELLAYNPGTDSWLILANLLQRREAHGSGVSGGTFCVFGGRIAQGGNFNTPFASMECYSPDTNEWAASVPLPIARQALGSVSVNGYIYAVGGHDHIKRGTTYFTRIKF